MSHTRLTTSPLEVEVKVTVSPGEGFDGENVNEAAGAEAAIRGERRASPTTSTAKAPERLKRCSSGRRGGRLARHRRPADARSSSVERAGIAACCSTTTTG